MLQEKLAEREVVSRPYDNDDDGDDDDEDEGEDNYGGKHSIPGQQ